MKLLDRPGARERVLIREVSLPATVVDRHGGFVFVRADAHPWHVATLSESEVMPLDSGDRAVGSLGRWVLGALVTCASAAAVYWVLRHVPEIVESALVALALTLAAAWFGVKSCR